MTKKDETRVSVMETQMLGWCVGIRRLGCITNDTIRIDMGVAAISKDCARDGWADLDMS